MALPNLNPDPDLQGRVTLAPNGRIVIPVAIREELGISPGDSLLMNVEDGVLQIESFATRIRRVQESFRQHFAAGRVLSDELIGDRREEALREHAEMVSEPAFSKELAEKVG